MKKALIYLLIFSAWLFLRIHYFVGYYYEDAPGYNADALRFALGQWKPLKHILGQHIGTYIPVGVSYFLFGKSEWTLSFWPLLSSFFAGVSLGACVYYAIGFFESVVVLLFYIFYPGLILFSTLVMPDGIQSSWMAITLSFLIFAVIKEDSRVLFYFLSGVSLGVSYLIRANAFLLLPLIVIIPICYQIFFQGLRGFRSDRLKRKETLTLSLVVFIGFLLVFSIEGIMYGISFNNIFYRFFVIKHHYGTADAVMRWGLNTDLRLMPKALLPVLDWIRDLRLFDFNLDQSLHGVFYLLFVPIYFYLGFRIFSVFKKSRKGSDKTPLNFILGVVYFIFTFLVLYHEFGSQDYRAYRPIHRLSRHFLIFAPWAFFLVAAFIHFLKEKIQNSDSVSIKRGAFVCGVSGLLFYFFGSAIAAKTYIEQGIEVVKAYERKTVNAMRKIKSGLIYIDSGSGHLADFYVNELGTPPDIRVHDIFSVKNCEEISEGYVLLNTTMGWINHGSGNSLITETYQRLPCLSHPPKNWKKLEFEEPIEGYRIQATF